MEECSSLGRALVIFLLHIPLHKKDFEISGFACLKYKWTRTDRKSEIMHGSLQKYSIYSPIWN